MSITPFGYGAFTVLGLSLILAFFVNRRFNAESDKPGGCFGAAYLGTIVVTISTLFATGLLILSTSSYALIAFPKYEATIVDVKSEWVERDYTDDDGFSRSETVEVHTAILTFTDETGEALQLPGNIRSGGKPKLGDTVTVAYRNGELHELSLRSVLLLFGGAIMTTLLGFLTTGMSLYAAHRSTEHVRNYGMAFLMFFVIPLGMFGMMVGLSWGVWNHYANDGDMPIWAQVVAIFFSLTLFVSLLGYFKVMFGDDEEPV